jgi:two-component system, sensor histidine kinase and response regulator
MKKDNAPLILSVDDDQTNLVLLERILCGKDYKVVSVTNGPDALDMLNRNSFDLILLDIMMPGMNGIEVLRRVRNKPETAELPVILISALSDTHSVAKGLESGANDYITKPIDMDVALARVQTQVALKQLQDHRKQTIAELEAAHEMKNRFLKIASHDLKGPLMNFQLATGLLKESLGEDTSNMALLEILEASIDTMQTLIGDFLDTTAVDTGVLDLHLDRVELNHLISDLMNENSLNAQRKNIGLEVNGWDGAIWADPSRFHQVLGNLVSNAVKYSPPDSTVSVWTEPGKDSVSIFVADHGPGIPPDEQDRLFTQFGKLTPRPTGGESSTGLGLWIVKHLVTIQNGEVGLISPPEGGSVFWVRMPAA